LNFSERLLYTALGAAVMFIGMANANLLIPITAQRPEAPSDAAFDEITTSH
jgi:hypothetical protein